MNTKIYIPNAVREVQLLHNEIVEDAPPEATVKEQLEELAENLLLAHQAGRAAAHIEIDNWHPFLTGKGKEEIMNASFELDDAKSVIAREHGFASWEEVEKNGCKKFNPLFEKAVETLLSGDRDALHELIKNNKALLNERSPFGHGATLLHYVASNGVELRRQQVPLNLVVLAKLLIAEGCDPDAKAKFYGNDYTPLELAATSAHPGEAGIMDDLLAVLKSKASQ